MVKQRMIEEASKLFTKIGVKRFTMSNFGKHLGISKRTIYENFMDKGELLAACINASFVENEEVPDLSLTDNTVEALLAVLLIGSEQQRLSLIEEVRKYYPQVYKEQVVRIIENRNDYFKEIIRRGKTEGVFRESINVDIAANFFSLHIYEALSHFENGLRKFSNNEIFENLAITFLRGICTPEGVEMLENLILIKKQK